VSLTKKRATIRGHTPSERLDDGDVLVNVCMFLLRKLLSKNDGRAGCRPAHPE